MDASNDFNTDPLKAQQLQRRLHYRALLGILLTSLLVGGIGTLLLYRNHSEHLRKELLFAGKLQTAAVGAELARLSNIAVQITSRTRIRQELDKFSRGEVSLAALRAFTIPKLTDPLKLIKDLRGITRLGLDGSVLIQVGETIDAELWPQPIAEDTTSTGNPQQEGERISLVVSAPILKRDSRRLGTDLLLFDAARLQAILADFENQHHDNGTTLIALGRKYGAETSLLLAQGAEADSSANDLLKAVLSAPKKDDGFVDEHFLKSRDIDRAVILSQAIPDSPWFFLYVSPAHDFYAPAQRQALFSLGMIVLLTLIGIMLTSRLMRPVAGRISVETGALHELLGRNERLLSQIQANQAQLQAIIDNAPSVIYVKGLDRTYRLVNASFERLVGKARDEILGRTDHELFSESIAHQFEEHDRQVLEANRPRHWDEKVPDKDAMHDYLSLRFPLRDGQGEAVGVCGISTDISERKQIERQIALSAAVFTSTSEGIVITEMDGTIIDANPAFTQMMGYQRLELVGQKPDLWKSDRHDQEFYREMWKTVRKKGRWRGEIWNRRKDGETVAELLTINCVTNENDAPRLYAAVYSDISRLKESERKLAHLAHHDALTGLPNRLLFNDRLGHAIERAKRAGSNLAVIFLDLDRFKEINDTLGHHIGDELLRAVARVLAQCLREQDTVARMGGDEFTMLIEDLASAEDASLVAAKVLQSFEQGFNLEGNEVRVSPSIGISLYPQHGDDCDSLLHNADEAMYRAKADGRNNYKFANR